MEDWRRQWLVRAIKLGLALVLWAVGEATGLFQMLAPTGLLSSPALHFAIMWIAADLLSGYASNIIARRVFRPYYKAWTLTGNGSFLAAVEAYREQLDFLSRHPWVEQFRTVVLLDIYRETLAERFWTYIASVFMRLGDTRQMVASYEKCLEINPTSYHALFALSLIAARAGGPARPFTIPKQQLRLGRGWLAVFITLGLLFSLWWVIDLPIPGLLMVRIIAMSVLVPFAIIALLLDVPQFVYSWLANRVLQSGYHRAFRLASEGRLEEAIANLEQDAEYWRRNPGLQKLRWLFLDATPRSYLERTLRLLAIVGLKSGKPEILVKAYREILAINPESDVRMLLELFEDSGS